MKNEFSLSYYKNLSINDIKEDFFPKGKICDIDNTYSNISYDLLNRYKYSTCSMICMVDLYVIYVQCECRMLNDEFIKPKIEYFDICFLCQVDSFTHPCEWSTEGDYRFPSCKDEWEENKSYIIDRIYEGYYDYELGYKAFDLVQ